MVYLTFKNRYHCLIVALLLFSSTPVLAQFKYLAWNLGVQTGKMDLKNGISRWDNDFTQSPAVIRMVDSADTKYWLTNFRFNIEGLTSQYYVKAGISMPMLRAKNQTPNSIEHSQRYMVAKHWYWDMAFAYGFHIKKRVGFHFGLNMGIFNLSQVEKQNGIIYGQPATLFDYFVPSASSTPIQGSHFFGNGAAWQIGGLINNVIIITDQIALRTSFSHNFLNQKKTTVHGTNDQIEAAFYYYNPEWRDLGFNLTFVQNWVRYKSYGLEQPIQPSPLGYDTGRLYPSTKAILTSFYLGINVPLGFSSSDSK